MTSFIRTNEANDDTLFVPALTPIGSEDLEPVLHPRWEEVLQKLDLLPVETEIIPICESRMCHSE
jgi:hypothetical protein